MEENSSKQASRRDNRAQKSQKSTVSEPYNAPGEAVDSLAYPRSTNRPCECDVLVVSAPTGYTTTTTTIYTDYELICLSHSPMHVLSE